MATIPTNYRASQQRNFTIVPRGKLLLTALPALWQFAAVKATKSQELRARVEPLLKLAMDKQAEVERLTPPDILRKALWDYLIKVGSPFVSNG